MERYSSLIFGIFTCLSQRFTLHRRFIVLVQKLERILESEPLHQDNDRSKEHSHGFSNYAFLRNIASIGNVLEIGAGPFTQVQF